MPLSKEQIRDFKSQAHHLKPVVMIGQRGLTEAVVKETAVALHTHQLIKVKIASEDKTIRRTLAQQLCQVLEAHFVADIGKIAIIYKRREENEA